MQFTNQPWFSFIIGSASTFLVTWLIDCSRNKKQKKEYLYYLQRMIVDQVNSLVEVKNTIKRFMDLKLSELLKNIENNPNSAYSVDTIFFPLFSIRSLPEEINMKSSGSGYIDNKVGKIYALSKDLPHIIEDIRLQLRETLEMNQKIAFGKLNSQEVQKEQYKRNILEYQKMIKEEILEINIPLYFNKLAETLVAVREKTNMNFFRWKIKFDPRWKYYFKNADYLKDRKEIMENMDMYFKNATEKLLKEISVL